MIRYESLHHVSLNVRNLERARKFYSEVLGLEPLERPPLRTEGVWYAVGQAGQQLHLIEYEGQVLRGERTIDSSDGHFALRIASYRDAIAWLDRCGVEYEARPDSRTGFPQIYVLDPDGNVVELNAEKV